MTIQKCRDRPIHANRTMRVICVGAGVSGLYLAYKLRKQFTDYILDIYEKNPDIGGTWFENRYPGCACDIPAHNYTYTFEPNPNWSTNYASAVEIFEYFSGFAKKYDLRQFITCHHEVVGAFWKEDRAEWSVKVRKPNGAIFEQRCDFLINGAGILNAWRWPDIAGLDSFQGTLVHTAQWDEAINMEGKKVGVIGNGSSGVQILPRIQRRAQHVTAFSRGPTWITPSAGMEHHVYTDEEKQRFRDNPSELLDMRKSSEAVMASAGLFSTFLRGSHAQDVFRSQMENHMRGKILDDNLAKKLVPDFPFGCRRPTQPGTDYLESLTRPNVTICHEAIEEITPSGCVTADGQEHLVDILVCATGFDNTFRPRFPIIGRDGANLGEEWEEEPRNYLSVAVNGFPNYFMFTGPNCPFGSGGIIVGIEAEGTYMTNFFNRWQKEDIKFFDPKKQAVDEFMEQKDLFMDTTVWAKGCRSWWKHNKTGKVTALWPGSTLHYLEALAHPRYDDFEVQYACSNRFSYLGNGFSQRQLDPTADLVYYLRERDEGSIFADGMSTRNAKDLGGILTEKLAMP
ncbi:hypothetical protein BBP40_006223 [Aspergillus hancockii]|nr:hypothetical protein BBP40_006223 [Aspergillus hancockii]